MTSVYLIQEEAAKLLRLSPRTLERQRLDGTGPKFVKLGRRVLYRASDMEAWLQNRTFQSTSEVDAVN
jgi:predicted DNA-binding transcriptional regulator AlpA